MKKLLFLIFAVFLSSPAWAATYYASPSGGGAASCVDSGANVCSLARAIVVAGTGTHTIVMANGNYVCSTACVFDSGNTGANLTFQPAGGATVGVTSSGSTYVFDIQASMVSGSLTFDGINSAETDTDYTYSNRAPEVNLTVKNSTITNSDATVGTAIVANFDATNKIALDTGEDSVVGLRTGATTNVKVAQKIVVGGSNIVVNRAALMLKRRCGNTGTTCGEYVSGESWDYRNGETLTVTIETDTAGAPSGTPVTNGTANTKLAFNVPYRAPEYYSFQFASNVTLTAGTTYWLVIAGNYTASTSNYIEVQTDTGNGYASGDSATYDGTTWTGAAAGTDLMFAIDRAHTRNITFSNNVVNVRSTIGGFHWADTVIIDGNTLVNTSGSSGILSFSSNNNWVAADDKFKRIEITNNSITQATIGASGTNIMFGIATVSFERSYTGTVIIANNTGIGNIITQPREYVRKLFIYGNNLEIVNNGNAPFVLGKEVDGAGAQELSLHPFDQVIIEKNYLNFSATSHNHLFLLGIGTEDGVFVNNTLIAPGASGGWGIIIKADRWTVIGNKYYGPGPAIYPTSNHNRIMYNTFESVDAAGSNATILFRAHQNNIYGGNHGIPKFSFIENNIFISNGSNTNFSALTMCERADCTTGASTAGEFRTSDYWSNRIDNNIYYARDSVNYVRIGVASQVESVTLGEGLSVLRATWQDPIYTNKDSLNQYNDMSSNNSYIGSIGGVSGVNSIFTTSDGNVVNKGTISGTNIGGYQSTGGGGSTKMGLSL